MCASTCWWATSRVVAADSLSGAVAQWSRAESIICTAWNTGLALPAPSPGWSSSAITAARAARAVVRSLRVWAQTRWLSRSQPGIAS